MTVICSDARSLVLVRNQIRRNGLFVLYYGEPLGPDGHRIRAATPSFVVVGAGQEARAEVPAFYHSAGVKVVVYVAMGYGRNPVDLAVERAMASGFDGVFFDETDAANHVYNLACAQAVKRCGAHKLVVMNPGCGVVDPSMFLYADIVGAENQWNQAVYPSGHAPWRWLAVQGDPASAAAGSLRAARSRLNRFRRGGGFWYYSAPYAPSGATHVRLADWFERFASDVKAMASPDQVTADPPSVTELFLTCPGDSTPAESVVGGRACDVVLRVDDPGGFAALAFGDVWWTAGEPVTPGVSLERGGEYLPGQNYVLSVSLSDRTIWAKEIPGSVDGWTNVTATKGLYVDGTRYVVRQSANEVRVRIELPHGPDGVWSLCAYVQRPPFIAGARSEIRVRTFRLSS